MAASPIPSIRSGTMRESGTAALPYVHTHPTGFKDAERAGGTMGESQPRWPAQDQQVAARRRRTAHPTVMPRHDYVHVEGIKKKCCQPPLSPLDTITPRQLASQQETTPGLSGIYRTSEGGVTGRLFTICLSQQSQRQPKQPSWNKRITRTRKRIFSKTSKTEELHYL